jgi:hypothetical protein
MGRDRCVGSGIAAVSQCLGVVSNYPSDGWCSLRS